MRWPSLNLTVIGSPPSRDSNWANYSDILSGQVLQLLRECQIFSPEIWELVLSTGRWCSTCSTSLKWFRFINILSIPLPRSLSLYQDNFPIQCEDGDVFIVESWTMMLSNDVNNVILTTKNCSCWLTILSVVFWSIRDIVWAYLTSCAPVSRLAVYPGSGERRQQGRAALTASRTAAGQSVRGARPG